MTGYDDELDADERVTAQLLILAFATTHHGRPSSITDAAQDDDTARQVASAFSQIRHDREPEPAYAAPSAVPLVPLPTRGRRRWPVLVAGGAAAAVVALGVVSAAGPSPTWAAEPSPPSRQEVADIGAACGAPLSRGLGDVISSGAVTVDGSTSATVPAPAPGPTRPTALPPLGVLDVRGDVAFAVYQDSTWTATCVATRDASGWHDEGLQLAPGPAEVGPAVVAAGGSAQVGGEQITTVTGAAPRGTTRLTFRLDDGTEVRASLSGTTWAAWFPGDRRIDPTTIRAFGAGGAALPRSDG